MKFPTGKGGAEGFVGFMNATPANWKDGDEVIIVPAVSDEEANKMYPQGFRKVKPNLRYVDRPS